MMNDHQTYLVSLLLGSLPNFQSGDAEAALTAYELIMSRADERDLQPAVMLILDNRLPGYSGAFAPTAPQLSSAIRIVRDKRLEAEAARRPVALPPPVEEITPEQRAKGKAILDQLAEQLGAQMRTDDAAADRQRSERTARVNARFAPSMDHDDMARRLGIGRISVGDPDAEEDMGNRGAA